MLSNASIGSSNKIKISLSSSLWWLCGSLSSYSITIIITTRRGRRYDKPFDWAHAKGLHQKRRLRLFNCKLLRAHKRFEKQRSSIMGAEAAELVAFMSSIPADNEMLEDNTTTESKDSTGNLARGKVKDETSC